MKKVLSILFAIILLCIGIIPSYAANPVISVNTVSSASVGETITVSVNLSANSKLAGINFTVSFNTTEFTLVSESVSTTSLLMGITNVGNSSIKYAGVSDAAVNSGGTLLSFKLKVLKTGGRISLSLNDAIDENDNFVRVSTSGATVNCSHANMNWTVTQKATCTANGTKKGTCACGYTKTESIQKTNHTYGGWVVEKQPTETKTGLKVSKCSVCGDKKEQVIPVIATTPTKPSNVTTTRPNETTRPSVTTTTKPSEVTTKAPASTTTTKPGEDLSQESTTEPTTEVTTVYEESVLTDKNTTELTTEEQTTAPTPQIVEKTSTPKIITITVLAVLGIEAIGMIIFFAIKKKRQK